MRKLRLERRLLHEEMQGDFIQRHSFQLTLIAPRRKQTQWIVEHWQKAFLWLHRCRGTADLVGAIGTIARAITDELSV